LEPIRTQPFACDFWPKEDAARTVLASQALFPECHEASALQRSGDFVLILAKGLRSVRASMRRRRDAHGAAGEDVDAREAADGSVASGGLPEADPHRKSADHDRGRIDL
jgi:hypothetical protein